MESLSFAESILRLMRAKTYRPQKASDLARALGISEEQTESFRETCKSLADAGRIAQGPKGVLTLPAPPGKVIGVYRSNPRGFGFIIPDQPFDLGDLYVPEGQSLGAMNGDTVAAKVFKRGKRQGKMAYEGRVTAIVERGLSRVVGPLRKEFGRYYVVPDGRANHGPVIVTDVSAKNAKPGDQVIVEIVHYPVEREPASGVIVRVLGQAGTPDVDTQSIIAQHGLPGEFEEEVLAQAVKAARSFRAQSAARGREDVRGRTTITIDPVTARDFDDAITLVRRRDGTAQLGVHIADVSHFVSEGSPLDLEARDRGNSIYLPRVVIPMLPESLSNGVCSLQEDRDRLTKSAFIDFDSNGQVLGARVSNTIIRSNRRFTYEEVDSILEGASGVATPEIVRLIKSAEALARVIHTRRVRDGMLVLDLPEVEMLYDKQGRLTGVEPSSRSFSHTIIEMFMVEANEAVARLLHENGTPCLRRVHEEGVNASDGSLKRFLDILGFKLPARANRTALQELLAAVEGHTESFAVNLALLKSMQQAIYSPRAVGHFALASEHYCHFTSPIRRYPDLTIHRLIDRFLGADASKEGAGPTLLTLEQLEQLGGHCSERERRAEDAERELKRVLTLRLLESHIGKSFDGIVTGLHNAGAFVQLDKFLTDGFLSFDEMADDWWDIDSSRARAVGKRTGCRVTVGQRLRVVIAGVEVATRRLDLGLESTDGSRSKRKNARRSEPSPSSVVGLKPTDPRDAKPKNKPKRGPKSDRRGGGKKASARKKRR